MSEIKKRDWETLFENMNPARFDVPKRFPPEQYEPLLIHVKDGWSLLDAGCATANLYKYTKKRNISYTGMDIDQHLLDGARERHPEANLKLGSIMDIPFLDNDFDVVYVRSVLEHIHPDEIDIAINELVRVAKRMLILSFHNPPSRRRDKTRTKTKNRYFENTFSKFVLLNLIKKTGRFIDIETYMSFGRRIWIVTLK